MCKGHSRQFGRQFGGHYWVLDEKGYGKCEQCPAEQQFALVLDRADILGKYEKVSRQGRMEKKEKAAEQISPRPAREKGWAYHMVMIHLQANPEWSMSQIARELGISRERVRQLVNESPYAGKVSRGKSGNRD